MDLMGAAYKGMAIAASEYNKKREERMAKPTYCVVCKDDDKNCHTCPRLGNDDNNLNALTLLEDL